MTLPNSRVDPPAGARSGNRMGDPSASGAVYHDLDRDDAVSHATTETAGDITAVVTVASKTVIRARMMAKASEKLVAPAFPSFAEYDELDDRTGVGVCMLWGVLGRTGGCLASRVLLESVRTTIEVPMGLYITSVAQ